MKTVIAVCMLLFLLASKGYPIGEHIPAGGRSKAMGGCAVAVSDHWSVGNNQAGTAWLKGFSAGLNIENQFLLKELVTQQFGIALPLKAGTFGLIVNRFGNNRYNEIKAGLSFARKFGKHFAMGVQIDYLRINIMDEYGSKNQLTCEIGLMYQTSQRLVIGVQVLNPFPARITSNPVERLPVTICIGLSYQFSDAFLASAEVEKDLEHKPVFRAGAEYRISKLLYTRTGILINPMSFTFGIGLEFGKIKLDVASAYHQVLGFSPTCSLIYSIHKK